MTAGRPTGFPPALLAPLAWLFQTLVFVRNRAYDHRVFRIKRLPVPVLSVGNLSVGGTGKTPLVILLARQLAETGRRPAIVLRGYGGSNSRRRGSPALLVADGRRPETLTDAGHAGDEAILLAQELKSVPVVVSADRYRGGMLAVNRCGADLVILDDGFQHRALHRDMDLVALDGTSPWGNGRLLPAGLLREPARSLRRAHAVILTRSHDDEAYQQALTQVRRTVADTPAFRARHRAAGVRFPAGPAGMTRSLTDLRGLPLAGFAGLARPESFRATLEELGAQVVHFTALNDHQPFQPGQVQQLMEAARQAGAQMVVTTAKDLARMEAGTVPEGLAVLDIDIQVEHLNTLVADITTRCRRPGFSHIEDNG